jgi:hypothetical protein
MHASLGLLSKRLLEDRVSIQLGRAGRSSRKVMLAHPRGATLVGVGAEIGPRLDT